MSGIRVSKAWRHWRWWKVLNLPSTSRTDDNADHNQRSHLCCWHIDWFMQWNLWKNNSWLLHHDNAPAHTSLIAHEYFNKNNILTMPQHPFSPDMAPWTFLFWSWRNYNVLPLMTRSKQNHQRSWKPYRRVSFRSASEIGKVLA